MTGRRFAAKALGIRALLQLAVLAPAIVVCLAVEYVRKRRSR